MRNTESGDSINRGSLRRKWSANASREKAGSNSTKSKPKWNGGPAKPESMSWRSSRDSPWKRKPEDRKPLLLRGESNMRENRKYSQTWRDKIWQCWMSKGNNKIWRKKWLRFR